MGEQQVQTRWFTFGQAHVHSVGGFTYDKDVVVKITAPDPRAVMTQMFGRTWGFEYQQEPEMKYYPRGVKEVTV